MGFAFYCALCSGPLGIYSINVGSDKPQALKQRWRRLDNKVRRLEGEDVLHEDSKEWKDMEKAEVEAWVAEEKQMSGGTVDAMEEQEMQQSEEVEDEEMGDSFEENWYEGEGGDEEGDQGDDASENENIDNNIDEGSLPHDALDDDDDKSTAWSEEPELRTERGFDISNAQREETDSMYNYYEQHTYDPTKLTRDDVQWIDRCRLLAYTTDSGSEKKVYIGGRGRGGEYFDFEIRSRAPLDPQDEFQRMRPAYHSYDPETNGPHGFPFHEACFKIMMRCFGYERKRNVDNGVLYDVMNQHIGSLDRILDFDYGPMQGADQFWECYQGDEWSVVDPGPRPGIEEVVQSMLPAQLFDTLPVVLDLSHKVHSDPLTTLPYDVLHGIFANLSLKDTLSLVKASWHVLESTRDPAFWKLMIRLHILPIFWELNGLLGNSQFPSTFDWRGMFQWLNEITRGKFGMDGPLRGIANRRRIWNVCQQLRPLYYDRLSNDNYTEPSDAEAKAIFDTAVCLHKPITTYPPPSDTGIRIITAQFIRSWSEIAYRACDFETYWGADGKSGSLMGVGVTFGSVERLLGSKTTTKGSSLRIEAGDFIKEIRLLMSKLALPSEYSGESKFTEKDDPESVRESCLSGMAITLTSGKSKTVASNTHDANQRPMIVLPGMHLVGLTAEVASNGTISSFGLLQAPDPTSPPPSPLPTYTAAEFLLWSPKSSNIYSHPHATCFPIWSHPSFSLLTFPPPGASVSITEAMQTHSTLIWAETTSAYTRLNRISALVLDGEIIGIIFKDTQGRNSHGPHVGRSGPVPAMINGWQSVKQTTELDMFKRKSAWEEECMQHFEIDGAGGEVVSEVHTTRDRKKFKVITDQGRVGEFGDAGEVESEEIKWDVVKAEEGDVIVGLSACFGRVAGWSEGARMWSHWCLSDLGVVCRKVVEAEAK